VCVTDSFVLRTSPNIVEFCNPDEFHVREQNGARAYILLTAKCSRCLVGGYPSVDFSLMFRRAVNTRPFNSCSPRFQSSWSRVKLHARMGRPPTVM